MAATSLAARTASIVNAGAPGRCALASVSVGVHLEAQPLARAAEFELDDLAHADDGHGQEIAHRREHDVLGAHDDGRFVAAAQRVGPAVDLEVRLAELHVAIPVRTEQEVGAAEERRDEPRAGPLIQRARLADFLKRPRSMTPMRSAMLNASSWSCVTSIVVMPTARWISRIARRSSSRIFASSAPNGSSSSSTRGSCASARASATRCCWPPESSLGKPLVVALERDEPQQLRAPAAAVAAAHAARAQRELDVVGHRHVAEQRVVLEHEADLALACADVRDVAAVQDDAAVVDRRQARDRAQQRALAAARRAEQHEQLAFLDLRRDVADGRGAAEFLRYLLESDGHGLAASGIRPGRLRMLPARR